MSSSGKETSIGVATLVVRELRPHQWVKNLLIFVPLLTSHRLGELPRLWLAGEAFVAFCLAASATYVLNDVVDRRHDQVHPRKRTRPIASGQLAIGIGLAVVPVLVAASLVVALHLGSSFTLALVAYLALTTTYSFFAKRIALVDVLVLAALYTTRILAGGAATAIEVSTWLLAFSMFLFLDLALVKRYTDLVLLAGHGEENAHGRGYSIADRELLRSIGVTSGLVSVVVFTLYLSSEQVTSLYRTPALLWLVCPFLLYWIARMWLLASRGEIDADPIVAAVRDPASYIVGFLILAVIAIAM